MSSIGATQPNVKFILTSLQNDKPTRRNRSVAFTSSETGLINNRQSGSLPGCCTTEAQFKDKVLMNWVHDARKLTKFFILRVANKYLSVSAFLWAVTIPAQHRAYVFLLMRNVKTLRRIGCQRTAIDPVQGYLFRVVEQHRGKEVSHLYEQWLWHIFFHREKSGTHALQFCGPVRLGRCSRFST